MSPTTTTGRCAARARPMLAMSVARRLISAGEPAPSTMTASNSVLRLVQFVGNDRRQTLAVGEVIPGADGVDDLAADHQLRGAVAAGLEQDGVETHAGRQSRGPGLHRLGAADLAAFDGDRRVVGHVLGLERRDPNALAGQQSAQPGDNHGLTGIGGGAGDQQRAAHVVTFLWRADAKLPIFCGVSGAFASARGESLTAGSGSRRRRR